MIEIIKREIEKEARKRLRRLRRTEVLRRYSRIRFEKRTGDKGNVSAKKFPTFWNFHKHFDPAYCIKHSKFIAKGIWRSISDEKYDPTPSVQMTFDKPSGGKRYIV